MGIMTSFTIDELGFPLETDYYGLPIDYSEGMEVFAETFYNEATSLVPVDTGYLRSTIGYEWDDMGCSCWADADYAQYVEYGTVYMAEQPYFEPALNEALYAAEGAWMEAMHQAYTEEKEMLIEEEAAEAGQTLDFGNGQSLGVNLLGLFGLALILAFVSATIKFFQEEISSHFAQFKDSGGSAFSLSDNFSIEIY